VREYGSDVPEIMGDPRQLQQVFLNMMVNASQAMQEGGRLTIGTRKGPATSDGEATVEVVFRDTGCGIPPEIQATIFHPFVTRGKKGGTGLGLSISKNIIDLHGGEVVLESELGKGTTFVIRLLVQGPRAQRLKAEVAAQPSAPGAPQVTGDTSSPEFHVRSLVSGDPGSGQGEGGP